MIIIENIEFNEKMFIHKYSNEGFKIRKIGTTEIYDDAMDIIDYEYEETDIKIEQKPMKIIYKIKKLYETNNKKTLLI